MAELAVAGSVVGLISLSIQCCKGLTSYYSDYRSYSDEINRTFQRMDELKITCCNLKRELEGRAQPIEPTAVQAIGLIASCQNNIQKLDHALNQCRTTQLPKEISARIQSIRAKGLYPFKKKTLQTLEEAVNSVQKNLGSALQTLQLQISSDIKATVQDNQTLINELSSPLRATNQAVSVVKQQTEKTAIQVSDINDGVRTLRKDFSSFRREGFEEFEKISKDTQNNAQSIETTIATKLNEYGAEMRNALSQHTGQITGLMTKRTGQIEVLDEKIKSVLIGLISQPDLMRSVCDTTFCSNNPLHSSDASWENRVGKYRRKHKRKRCTCTWNSVREISRPLIDGVATTRNFRFGLGLQSLTHDCSCPLSKSYPKSTVVTAVLQYCGAMLARSIRASITINRGAGGVSIAHKLDIARVVPSGSRVFQLVNWKLAIEEGVIKSASDFDIFLRDSIKELQCLFRNGNASPCDVNEMGDTVLQVAGGRDLWRITVLAKKNALPVIPLMELLFWYHKRLAELGIPFNWTNNFNKTFLDNFVRCRPDVAIQSTYWAGVNQLVDDGAQFCNFHDNIIHWSVRFSGPILDCPEILYALDSNDLSLVVSQKSERDMLSVLTNDAQSINNPNQLGQTPLHLAVGWPFGVNILIKNGANLDSRDIFHRTPLSYALAHKFAETVGLLMKAGCSLGTGFFSNPLEVAIRSCVERPQSLWRGASEERRNATLTMFITALAERRRQVYRSLATAPIPEGINACWAQNNRVLDKHASCAEDALQYYDIAPSQASVCLDELQTVYHVVYLTAEIAEELWQAGFHDINVLDEYGQRPLSQWRHPSRVYFFDLLEEIELTSWLVERGASIYSPMRCLDSHSEPIYDFTASHPERRALHHIAANIGNMMFDLDLEAKKDESEGLITLLPDWLEQLSENSTQFMATIFSDPSPDRCLCACSSGGCTTSTILQKKWARDLKDPYDDFPVLVEEEAWSLQAAKCLMVLLEPHNTCEDWFIDEIIRFNTFQELQLKHTCCKHQYKRYASGFIEPGTDEINEFRNEDSEGIKLLEELVIEFRNQRGDQSLMTFLQGYWTSRMEEVHQTRGEVDLEKSREMGIVWSESN